MRETIEQFMPPFMGRVDADPLGYEIVDAENESVDDEVKFVYAAVEMPFTLQFGPGYVGLNEYGGTGAGFWSANWAMGTPRDDAKLAAAFRARLDHWLAAGGDLGQYISETTEGD